MFLYLKSVLFYCFYDNTLFSQSQQLCNFSLLKQKCPLHLGMFKIFRMYLPSGEKLDIEINYVGCHLLWFLGTWTSNLKNFSLAHLPLRLFYQKLDLSETDDDKIPRPQGYREKFNVRESERLNIRIFFTNIKNCLNVRLFSGDFG